MHLFFDTVWKLHIGEIPEKPKKEDHATYLSYYPELFKYNEAIDAIKQNALTVANPILCPQNMSAVEPGKFYEWIGGYETKEIQKPTKITDGKAGYSPITTVAILTMPEEKKNTMETMTKEQANLVRLINEGLSVIRQKKMEYLACSADGSPNQEYFKGKADAYEYTYKTFKRILEWTASGSVAAPKEEPIVNEVLYDNGEHSHLELLDHDGRIICSESELESLRDFVRDVDASLYHGPDLEDKEIMQHYIEVFKIIKEEARKLMNTCIQQTEQPEEAKIIEELKAKGARSFINENTALREALKDLLAITETNVFNYNEYKAIIERARKLISK